MKKLIFTLVAAVLMAAPTVPVASAQSAGDSVVGTWTFFVSIDGAPPCQCVQITRLRADGTLDGPGSDQFSGQALGEWKRTSYRDISFAFVQNNFNSDGSAGGEYIIRGVLTLGSSSDQGGGTSSFQLIDNSGKVIFSGTATFRASKLKLDQ